MDNRHLTNNWPESINANAPRRGISGIYQIVNTLNGKFYVGSSFDIRQRWLLHLWTLRDGSNHCQYLQNAWKKSEEGAFVFEIIETCEQDSLLEREQFYLDTLNPAYNMCRIAGKRSGIPWTEKAKETLRRPRTSTHIERMRQGVKRSYDVNPHLRELRAQSFKAYRNAHPDLLRGDNNHMRRTYRTHPGWIKMQTSEEVERKRIATRQRMIAEGYVWRAPKPVEQLTLEGDVIKRWPSRVEAAAAIGCADVSISHVCVGRTASCYGFKWRYAE